MVEPQEQVQEWLCWSNLVSHLLVAADATIDWLRSVTGVGHVVTTVPALEESHLVDAGENRNPPQHSKIYAYFNVASDLHIHNIRKYKHVL